MFLDLHTHSVSSDDSRATVEQYVKWAEVLRRRGYALDGFVLTEHRKFDLDADYSALARDNDVVILKGSELDTSAGHFLVYGVTEELCAKVDFADVTMDAVALVEAAAECGALAVPAHPGREGIGLYAFIEDIPALRSLRVAERLNGSNRPGEERRAEELISRYGFLGTGGSDAHLASALGSCLTSFDREIESERDLVRELGTGGFRAVRLDETRRG